MCMSDGQMYVLGALQELKPEAAASSIGVSTYISFTAGDCGYDTINTG